MRKSYILLMVVLALVTLIHGIAIKEQEASEDSLKLVKSKRQTEEENEIVAMPDEEPATPIKEESEKSAESENGSSNEQEPQVEESATNIEGEEAATELAETKPEDENSEAMTEPIKPEEAEATAEEEAATEEKEEETSPSAPTEEEAAAEAVETATKEADAEETVAIESEEKEETTTAAPNEEENNEGSGSSQSELESSESKPETPSKETTTEETTTEETTTEETTTSTTTTTTTTSTSGLPIYKPAFVHNGHTHIVDKDQSETANCPGLSCPFGYKTDLFGKPICSCFNPCLEKKCGSNICKIEKFENRYVGACYDPNKVERPIHCLAPLATGHCRNYTSRYYFNSFKSKCFHFIYTGCNGNDNNFPTWEKCEMECNVCTLPVTKGPCHGNIIRWHFDSVRKECVAFNWGGCKGNENNFATRKHCEESCLFRKEGALFLNGMPIREIRIYHKDGRF